MRYGKYAVVAQAAVGHVVVGEFSAFQVVAAQSGVACPDPSVSAAVEKDCVYGIAEYLSGTAHQVVAVERGCAGRGVVDAKSVAVGANP